MVQVWVAPSILGSVVLLGEGVCLQGLGPGFPQEADARWVCEDFFLPKAMQESIVSLVLPYSSRRLPAILPSDGGLGPPSLQSGCVGRSLPFESPGFVLFVGWFNDLLPKC